MSKYTTVSTGTYSSSLNISSDSLGHVYSHVADVPVNLSITPVPYNTVSVGYSTEVETMASNKLREVYVVRSDGDEYQIVKFGPYVSSDPEALVRELVQKNASDAIFKNVTDWEHDLTFVIQTELEVIPDLSSED